MKKLLEKKIGATLQESTVVFAGFPNPNKVISAIWPFAKFTLYDDRIAIKVLWQGEHVLMLNEIDSIKKRPFDIQLHHRSKKVLPFVYVKGVGNASILFKKLVEAIKRNHLQVVIA